jgi:hypothetical protein
VDPEAEHVGPPAQCATVEPTDGDVLAALFAKLGPADPPGSERRRAVRHPCRGSGSIRIVGVTPANSAIPIFLCDANNFGIGFFCRGDIRAGAECTATVVWPDGRISGVDGYVARSREVRPGWRHAALLFFQPQQILQYVK